jgi:glycosyltransferase involved in cell wall biosynthesis
VPDVRPFLAGAGALAVPLRIGGGSRLKILEAIAAGLPVVSTRVGCEGLRFTPGRDLSVVESPADMPDALVECIRNPGRAAAMAANGRAVINQHYDWSGLAARLERVWLDTVRAR